MLLPIVYSFSPFLSLSSSYLPTFLSVKYISYVLFARHCARVPGAEGIDVKAMVSVQFAHKNLKIILQILCDSARHIILWTQWQFSPGVCGRDLGKGKDYIVRWWAYTEFWKRNCSWPRNRWQRDSRQKEQHTYAKKVTEMRVSLLRSKNQITSSLDVN